MEKPTKRRGIYMLSVLNRRVVLPFRSVGNNISELLVENLVNQYEGKCVKEGFIKKNSIRILNFSAGKCSGTNVLFNVSFECLVCCPIEGMNMKVIVKNSDQIGVLSSGLCMLHCFVWFWPLVAWNSPRKVQSRPSFVQLVWWPMW